MQPCDTSEITDDVLYEADVLNVLYGGGIYDGPVMVTIGMMMNAGCNNNQ